MGIEDGQQMVTDFSVLLQLVTGAQVLVYRAFGLVPDNVKYYQGGYFWDELEGYHYLEMGSQGTTKNEHRNEERSLLSWIQSRDNGRQN